MTNFLFFGDSITYGEYDGVLGGYVDYLKRFSHAEYYNNKAQEVNCFNLGIGGETTVGLLKRFEVEVQARLSPDENEIFFFYGANDLAIKKGVEMLTLPDFEKNISQAIQLAKKYTDKVNVISIIPISEKLDGIPTTAGTLRTTEKIELFNTSLKRLSTENSVNFINIYSSFNLNKEELISNDGVHPNENGYELIAENIKPIIEKYL